MNKKIRLVGGPFGGKVVDDPKFYGGNEIVYRGPKKMTRRQRYEHEANMYKNPQFMYMSPEMRYPQAEARYRMSIHPYAFQANGSIPCMHPDGSIFYEYVEGSKREFS